MLGGGASSAVTGPWCAHAPPAAMARSGHGGAGPSARLPLVEVADDDHPAVRDPDADAGTVVDRVHQVPIVTAIPGLLVLEVTDRVDRGGTRRHARRTAQVLGPLEATEARPPESGAGTGPHEVGASAAVREQLRVGPRDARRNSLVKPER